MSWHRTEAIQAGTQPRGVGALESLTKGNDNTAVGFNALFKNTAGFGNTAAGSRALFRNTGFVNTAIGEEALFNNATGNGNAANGWQALFHNTWGQNNTADGTQRLYNNTGGGGNVAIGVNALCNNTVGFDNTAIGADALFHHTTGFDNVGIGSWGGANLTIGNDNIDISNGGVAGESGTIRIGFAGIQKRTFIAGIREVAIGNANALNVVIDSDGQFGTISSSRRYKKEIKPMDHASEAILDLKPVMFYYKNDTKGAPQFGLIAEEVAKVNPDLIVRDDKGEIYTVRYDAVNAMLLNEFLKEHRTVKQLKSTVEKQEATISQLKSTVAKDETIGAEQQKEIKALAATVKE